MGQSFSKPPKTKKAMVISHSLFECNLLINRQKYKRPWETWKPTAGREAAHGLLLQVKYL
jgi:hypothetical protein